VLVIRGGLSDILSVETLERMAATHPQLTTLTLPHRGHAPMLDEPAAMSAIDAFVQGVEP
jgi:pimeloyl-ACP methyl ester carboxylesterase